MKVSLWLAIAGFLFFSQAKANERIGRQPIEQFLTAFDHSSLPRINLTGISKSEIADTTIGEPTLKIAAELNDFLFATRLFTLRSCDGCKMIANLGTFEIFVDPKFLERMEMKARSTEEYDLELRFMLAHEFSHYIYELATQKRLATDGIEASPNGNKSFRQLMKDGIWDHPDHLRAHAEVDSIAVVILERMGFKNARTAAIELLRRLNFKNDGAFRIQTLEAL